MSTRKVIAIFKLVFVSVVAVVCAVAAVVCFAPKGFFGWFARNEKVTANGMNVTVESPTSVIDKDNSACFLFEKVNAGKYVFFESETTDFNVYSILENNVYQAILKIKINSNVKTVSVSAVSEAAFYLGDDDSDHLLSNEGNSLSSIISFELYSSDGSQITPSTDSSGGSTVNTLEFAVPSKVDTFNFINEDKTINPNVSLGQIEFSNAAADNYVYVVMKYNGTAIEEIFTKNIGTSYMHYIEQKENPSVPFALCDFSIHVV